MIFSAWLHHIGRPGDLRRWADYSMNITKLTKSDAEEMFHILQHAEIYKYISTGKPPNSLDKFIEDYKILEKGISLNGKHKCQYWIVRDDDSKAIGFLELFYFPLGNADFAYVFTPSAWGKNYAYRSSKILIDQIIRKDLDKLYATVDPRNIKSINLLTRLGFENIPQDQYNNSKVESNDLIFRKMISAQQGDAPEPATNAIPASQQSNSPAR